MGLFGFGKKTNEGGLMDAISLGEVRDYLIYKWRPKGENAGDTKKENAIRTGSSLLVNEGQAAMFIYANEGGKSDVIIGPYNKTIDTGNFPVLTNIIGAAFGGGTPFQAQVYYITLQEALQVKFTTGWFTVPPSQQAYMNYEVPVCVDGSIMFNAAPSDGQLRNMFMRDRQMGLAGATMSFDDYRLQVLQNAVRSLFHSWGGKDTTLKYMQEKMSDMMISSMKSAISNLPPSVFVLHLNKLLKPMAQAVFQDVVNDLNETFGVWPSRMNITDIRFKEDDDNYQMLKRITTGSSFNISLQNEENVLQQLATDAAVRNGMVVRQAEIQMDHQEDMLGRMREEAQFAQHTQTESTAHRTDLSSEQAYLGAHTVNVQGGVMQTGMESLGQMGTMNFGGGDGGAMNPAGMMMGMGMASGMAGQMGQMMGNMGSAFNNQVMQAGAPTPPPMPGQMPPAPPTPQAAAYFVLVNNQQMGPCDINALRQMAASGQLTAQTMVWANGMPQWAAAGTVPALAPIFQAPQQMPPTPPMPGSVPPPPPTF